MDSSIVDGINVKWNRYMRWKPTPKQLAYLMYTGKELLFGGAAGGGKSAVLTLAALQYCDVPGYSAIIFRNSLRELEGPDGIITKMNQLLAPFIQSKEVKYNSAKHYFTFNTIDWDGKPGEPSRIDLGYIGDANTKTKYQGSAFQFVAFDELTHHVESDYSYMFTRLRKNVCPIHQLVNGEPNYVDDCPICQIRSSIPLRVRAATNPGGRGAGWVKRWFKIEPDRDVEQARMRGEKVKWIGRNPDAPFLPSFLSDNTYIDQSSYRDSFKRVDDETRAQLEDGSWAEGGSTKFKRQWFPRFSTNGNHIILGRDKTPVKGSFTLKEMKKVWISVDSAASATEGQLDTELFPKKDPSWTVFQLWALTHNWCMLLLDMQRFQEEVPVVVDNLVAYWDRWKVICDYALVENKGTGLAVVQEASRRGVEIKVARATKDKVVRATPAMMRAKSGRIWLPQDPSIWLTQFEQEVFTWQGYPNEQDDIVDTLAHAVNDVEWPDDLDTNEYWYDHSNQDISTDVDSIQFVDPTSIDISSAFDQYF